MEEREGNQKRKCIGASSAHILTISVSSDNKV